MTRLSMRACAIALLWPLTAPSAAPTSAPAVSVTNAPAGLATNAPAVASEPGRAVVIARRNLMAAVGRNMDGITGMIEPGGKVDPADAAEHADEIAVMLMAFPHLFSAASDNWTRARERNDPAGVTEAAPALWRERKAFEAMAAAASQIATDASRSADVAQFRVRADALQNACNSCHTRFRREEKPYTIPIPPLAAAPAR